MAEWERFVNSPRQKFVGDVAAAATATVQRQAEAWAGRWSRGPQLLFTGEAAARYAAGILATAATITLQSGFGYVELRPGTIWNRNRMLISVDTAIATYMIGDGLYRLPTSQFLREEWFGAAERAVAQAEGIVYLAKIEVAVISGLLVPWQVLFAVGAASLGLQYYHHRELFNAVLDHGSQVLRFLNDMRSRYPTLFKKLLATTASDVLDNLPSSYTAEDVGFFVGRLVRGIASSPEITLGVILRTVVKTGALVTASHFPAASARAMRQASAQRAEELRVQLAAQGIAMTPQESESIIRELLADSEASRRLRDLEQALEQLIPELKRLNQLVHQ